MQAGYRELARRLQKDGMVQRWTQLSGAEMGRCVMRSKDGVLHGEDTPKWESVLQGLSQETAGFQHQGNAFLQETLCAGRQMIVCGAGHISVPVCALAKLLGYTVSVLDDRPEFAVRARFPAADVVQCADFEQTIAGLNRAQNLSFVIVTRGHQADLRCLRAALHGAFSYIGMIGSRQKNQTVLDTLRGEGVSEGLLRQVHAPIGLPIGAQTPEEIAVSIAAEWVQTSAHAEQTVLTPAVLEALLNHQAQGIMTTVVQKNGSAPRGIGARMLFFADGAQYGTVGGGAAEHAVCQTARELLRYPSVCLREYALHASEAAASGMICGGSIAVLFEPVEALQC